jgi:hypothetical protein
VFYSLGAGCQPFDFSLIHAPMIAQEVFAIVLEEDVRKIRAET